MTRKIIHIDLDAFFCAVEAQLNPALQGKAFAVGGRPDQRGVVAACSYEARRYGIRSAMPMAQAVRRCPDLIIVSQHRGDYQKASKLVMAVLHDLTPLVEQLSIDEAFADVTMLHDEAITIARQLQATINTDLDLPCSLGVATNKLIAKIANTVGKKEASAHTDGAPNTIKEIPPGQEAAFLAPLPTTALWGIGPRTADRLHQLGINTIGELAARDESDLVRHFGKHGAAIARHAKGIDTRPLTSEHDLKSISHETTYNKDVDDITTLTRTLRHLSDSVGRRARKANTAGTTIKIKLRWSDFTTLTRQSTLPYATDQDDDIYEAAVALLKANWQHIRPVRLIGVGLSGFSEPHRQLGLWDDPADRAAKQQLQNTLDDLRDRFGDSAVRRGSTLKKRNNQADE